MERTKTVNFRHLDYKEFKLRKLVNKTEFGLKENVHVRFPNKSFGTSFYNPHVEDEHCLLDGQGEKVHTFLLKLDDEKPVTINEYLEFGKRLEKEFLAQLEAEKPSKQKVTNNVKSLKFGRFFFSGSEGATIEEC